jgi:hypothetical protein
MLTQFRGDECGLSISEAGFPSAPATNKNKFNKKRKLMIVYKTRNGLNKLKPISRLQYL